APSVAQTDWAGIVELYDLLRRLRPSPMVELNFAIALGEARGAEAGLEALGARADEPELSASPFLPAARGRLLLRSGRPAEAERAGVGPGPADDVDRAAPRARARVPRGGAVLAPRRWRGADRGARGTSGAGIEGGTGAARLRGEPLGRACAALRRSSGAH